MRILIGLLLVTQAASAATRAFSADSLIIPMDLCYQPTSGKGGWSSGSLPSGFSSSYCPDPVPTASDSVLKAYGLIYTLLQNSINVHYIIDPTRSSLSGVDLTITKAAGDPVYRVVNSKANSATLSQARTSFMKSGNTSVAFRGAPFVIDVADAPAALKIIQDDATSASPQFNNVKIYWAMTNFNAPEKGVLVGPPPQIALNGLDPTNVTILESYLQSAGLTTTTTTCNRRGNCTTTNTIDYWPTKGGAFTVVGYDGKYTDFTTSDALNAGGFKVIWSPHWEGVSSILNGNNNTITQTSAAQTALDSVLAKMEAFADAGNSTFAECVGLGTIEGINQVDTSPHQAAFTHGHFLTSASGSTVGLGGNYINGGWPRGNAGETFKNDDPLDPIVQIGDYVFNSVDGYTEDFTPLSGVSYVNGTTRLLYTVAPSGETTYNNRDIAIDGYKDGDTTKGKVVYLAGHSYATGTNVAGIRIPLNTLLFLGQLQTTLELTRSAPIVYSDGKTYLGTFVQKTQANTAYPPWDGHFREYPANALVGTNVTSFDKPTADWDAANNVKTQAAADSRTIFTAVPQSGKLSRVDFTTANLATLQTRVPTLTAAQITALRKGGLGGIDHSIPAIIPASSIAGSSSRPTVAYVGALDGMLHCFLISGSVAGKNPGDELWAFIPPSQLGATIGYAGGVDGSPSVGDAFIDTGSGTKQWRTLLGIPQGSFGGTLDVLDITDPTAPSFLWEASDSVTAGGKTFVMGAAQGAAIGPVMAGGSLKFAYFLATNNTNGTAGNGFNVYALDAATGTVLWRALHTYTADTSHNDVPGTVAAIDATGDGGPITKIYFGDIEGKVWGVDGVTGALGSAIYDAAAANSDGSSINYPIESGLALFRDPTTSHLSAVGVTGGADWVPPATTSHVFKLDLTTGTNSNLLNLAAGERVYAVPSIYGNQAYLITSTGNIQGAIGTDFSNVGGNLVRINLGSAGGATTLASVKGGAAEVAIDSSGNVVAASAAGITQNGNSGVDKSQSVISLQNLTAKLVTIRAWLDLR